MEPNEALFDAINRGDIGAARDAISRGADLQGHNILGMTPLELSVDLGRNDISFLLLSMRAGDEKANRQATAAQATAKPSADEAGEAGPGSCRTARRHGAAGPIADRSAVQRRRRHAEPERRLPGVRFQPPVMAGISSV